MIEKNEIDTELVIVKFCVAAGLIASVAAGLIANVPSKILIKISIIFSLVQFSETIFGRTDLKIGLSEAKFDAEADFEVRLAIALQKSCVLDEKLNV